MPLCREIHWKCSQQSLFNTIFHSYVSLTEGHRKKYGYTPLNFSSMSHLSNIHLFPWPVRDNRTLCMKTLLLKKKENKWPQRREFIYLFSYSINCLTQRCDLCDQNFNCLENSSQINDFLKNYKYPLFSQLLFLILSVIL